MLSITESNKQTQIVIIADQQSSKIMKQTVGNPFVKYNINQKFMFDTENVVL
jgi:hypothetical protein